MYACFLTVISDGVGICKFELIASATLFPNDLSILGLGIEEAVFWNWQPLCGARSCFVMFSNVSMMYSWPGADKGTTSSFVYPIVMLLPLAGDMTKSVHSIWQWARLCVVSCSKDNCSPTLDTFLMLAKSLNNHRFQPQSSDVGVRDPPYCRKNLILNFSHSSRIWSTFDF